MRLWLALVGGLIALIAVGWLALGPRESRSSDAGRAEPENAEPEDERREAELHAPAAIEARTDAAPEVAERVKEAVPAKADPVVDAPPKPTELVVRLLDELAQPFADRHVQARDIGSSATTHVQRSTDGEGRFRFPLDKTSFGRIELPDAIDFDAGGGRGARLTLPANLELRPGVIDLGDLVLGGMPLIASGIVQNPDGIPVPGALLLVQPFHVDADGREISSASFFVFTTRGDGLFALHGWLDGATTVRIEGRHQAAARGTEVELPIGSTGAVITLAGGGAIEGRVLLEDDFPADSLLLSAVNEATGKPAAVRVKLLAERRFVVPKLEPGTYALRIEIEGDDAPLYTQAGIVVKNGARTTPPELDPLDLRGRGIRHAITVVDLAGRPIPATVYTRFAEGSRWAIAAHAPDAPAVLYSKSDTIDVTAVSKDRGWCERRGVSGAATLVCGATYEVHVRLPAPIEMPEGVSLTAHLVPLGTGNRSGMASATAPFGPDGTCVLFAKGTGEHTLEIGVAPYATLNRRAWRPGEIALDVLGTSTPQTLSIDVTQADVEAAFRIDGPPR